MIRRLSHASIYVLDQARAQEFYTKTFGFEIRTDAPMGPDARWLTVSPPQQLDLEITLMPIVPGFLFTEESAANMRELVKNGTFGFGVFTSEDIHATYEELKAKGVKFRKEPTQEFYGLEALFSDDSGNWFSLVQRPASGEA